MSKKATFVLVMLALSCLPSFGQSGTPGTPSWSAYDTGAVDTLNIQNLTVSLNIPVMSKSGAFPFNFSLVGGNSYIYNSGGVLVPGYAYVPLVGAANDAVGGVLLSSGAGFLTATSGTCPYGYGSGSATAYSGWYVSLADRTYHYLPASDTAWYGATCSSGFTDQTIDGSGWTVKVTGGLSTVTSSGGMVLGSSSLSDSQSSPNSISINGTGTTYTDTLGMTVLTAGSANQSPWSWSDVAGGSPQVSIGYTGYTVKTSFTCPGTTNYTSGSGLNYPTSVTFPDTSTLGLAWEPNEVTSSDITGRIQEITLRGGGPVTYNWNAGGASSAPWGMNCTYLVPAKISRTTSDGTVTYSTAFSTGSTIIETVTKVDIEGNETIYKFSGFTATGLKAPPVTQALTETQYFINTGTVASPTYSSTPTLQHLYCYNGNSSACATSQANLPITEVDVYTTQNGMSTASRTKTQYDGGPSGSCGSGSGGCYGNVTYSAQYDFGASSPTVATTNTYTGCGASSPVHNKVCSSVTVFSGNTVASSKFTYSASGNLLTGCYSPNGGTSFLCNPTANSYYANGTPNAAYDLAGNKTQYGYNSSNYTGSPSNLPFATSITSPSGLITSAYYNSAGGVKTKDVDAAGNAWLYGYTDPWNRVTSITDPNSNVVNKSYTPTSASSTFAFGSSVNNVYTTVDGYARNIRTQTQQGPSSSNYDTVSAAYSFGIVGGASGTAGEHYVTTNIPCTAAWNANCTGTNQSFADMLNRPVWASDIQTGGYVQTQYILQDVLTTLGPAPSGESTKSDQKEFNGLGWLVSDCKVSPNSVSGTVSCGQANPAGLSGILTLTSYGSSSNGQSYVSSCRGPSCQQTRTKTVDSMKRVVATTSPEGGTNLYGYDTSGCYGTGYPGHLTNASTANGDGYCYAYDVNGRLILAYAQYPSSGATACRHYYYDGSTGYDGTIPSGITITNGAGRLTEETTDNCTGSPTSATIITDEWYSYSKVGDKVDIWEKTPNSGQYYHSKATFAANHALLTMQLVSPSGPTNTYCLDGEGRWGCLESNSYYLITSSNPVTRDAAGSTLTIPLNPTSGTEGATYTYTAAEQMNTYSFAVGGKTSAGTLTWNPNGSLGQVSITDGFNSGGTMTCPDSHDDLNRLVSFSCGTSSPWNQIYTQAFSLDQYDNVTMSGTSAFNPGFS